MTRLFQIVNQPQLTDAKVEQFLSSYQELDEIEVKNCCSLSHKTLRLLADRYPALKAVAWIDNGPISEEGLSHMIDNLSLRALNLSGNTHFSSSLCKRILSSSRSLKTLDVSFCPLTDEAFSSI
ncbi:MAG TPA: hypothetical protein VGM34_01735, partial [Chlamydiales bacterium]